MKLSFVPLKANFEMLRSIFYFKHQAKKNYPIEQLLNRLKVAESH